MKKEGIYVTICPYWSANLRSDTPSVGSGGLAGE